MSWWGKSREFLGCNSSYFHPASNDDEGQQRPHLHRSAFLYGGWIEGKDVARIEVDAVEVLRVARRLTTGKEDRQVRKLGWVHRSVDEQIVPFKNNSKLTCFLSGLSVVQLFGVECNSPRVLPAAFAYKTLISVVSHGS